MPDLESDPNFESDSNLAPRPTEKKSHTAKILIGCGLVAFVLMIVLGWLGYKFIMGAIVTDPAQIESMAQEMVATSAPEGFDGQGGMDVFGFKFAFLMHDDGHAIVLGSIGKAHSATLDAQMRDSFNKQLNQDGSNGEDLGTEKFEAAGEEIELKKTLHTNDGGEQLQLSGTLPERAGRVTMLIYMGPKDSFDQDRLAEYLKSIPPPK